MFQRFIFSDLEAEIRSDQNEAVLKKEEDRQKVCLFDSHFYSFKENVQRERSNII